MRTPRDASVDHHLTLADGRRLGYSDLGAPDGYPVVCNHGGLVCRLDVEPGAADAAAMGLRLISPDRPGVATSDRKPGHGTLDWADDVRELVDALGIERFGVFGWSMGGQYALAVAHGLADRVDALAVIAGCLPIDDGATMAELNPSDRALTRLAHRSPGVAAATFRAMGTLEAHFPKPLVRVTGRRACEADRTVLEEHADWLGAVVHEAMSQPKGMVDEYQAWVRPWGFTLDQIEVPVDIWQGTLDDQVPPEWALEMARRIPTSTLHSLDGLGHFVALTHRTEVLARLLEVARG